jgi:hypothetical protein
MEAWGSEEIGKLNDPSNSGHGKRSEGSAPKAGSSEAGLILDIFVQLPPAFTFPLPNPHLAHTRLMSLCFKSKA